MNILIAMNVDYISHTVSTKMNEIAALEEKYGVIMVPSLDDFDMLIFEAMNDEEFESCIGSIVTERNHMMLENQMFLQHLNANDPKSISGLQQVLSRIYEMEDEQPLQPHGFERQQSLHVMMPLEQRVNFATLIDLLSRNAEALQNDNETFTKNARKLKLRLRAEIQESKYQIQEIKNFREFFEQAVVIDGFNTITQRIQGEKFIRVVQDWYKSKCSLTEKLRRSNCANRTYYSRLKMKLHHKIQLSENMHEADYEQLVIDNKRLKEKITQKNTHLEEIKKLCAKACLILSKQSNYLQEILGLHRLLRERIVCCTAQKKELEYQFVITVKEVADAKNKYSSTKELSENYKVPDILEYVRRKELLHNSKKEIKILDRKINLLKIMIQNHVTMMMKQTNSKLAQKWWFTWQQDDFDKYHRSITRLESESSSSNDCDELGVVVK